MKNTKPSLKPIIFQITMLVIFYQIVSSGFQGMHNNIWNRYGKPFNVYHEGIRGDIRNNFAESEDLKYVNEFSPKGLLLNIIFWVPIIVLSAYLTRYIFTKIRGGRPPVIHLSNWVLMILLMLNIAVILRSRELISVTHAELNLPIDKWFYGWPHGQWIEPDQYVVHFFGSFGVNVIIIAIASFLTSATAHLGYRLKNRDQNNSIEGTK